MGRDKLLVDQQQVWNKIKSNPTIWCLLFWTRFLPICHVTSWQMLIGYCSHMVKSVALISSWTRQRHAISIIKQSADTMFRSKATTLRTLVFAEISFHEVNFRGCKFCQISRWFIFVDGEIIVISCLRNMWCLSLRKECPNTEFFLVRIFPLFSPKTGKYGPEKPPCLDIFRAVHV